MSGRVTDQTGRVSQVIAALCAAPDDISASGRRLQMLNDPQDPALTAILAEVSQTVLRRVLVFSTSTGIVLKLDVMERRVLHVISCSDERALDSPLTAADAQEVLGIMRRFAEGAAEVFVVAELAASAASTAFDGVPVADLYDLLDANDAASSLPQDVQNLFEQLQSRAIAILCGSDTEEVYRWGNDADCTALAQTGVARAPSGHVPDSLALWGSGADCAKAVLLVQWQGFRILILLPSDAVDAQFGLWHGTLFTAP